MIFLIYSDYIRWVFSTKMVWSVKRKDLWPQFNRKETQYIVVIGDRDVLRLQLSVKNKA